MEKAVRKIYPEFTEPETVDKVFARRGWVREGELGGGEGRGTHPKCSCSSPDPEPSVTDFQESPSATHPPFSRRATQTSNKASFSP